MKRQAPIEKAEYGVDQNPASLTRSSYGLDDISQSKPRDIQRSSSDAVEMSHIGVDIYSREIYGGETTSNPSREGLTLAIPGCYSCGSHDSSYCNYCGRCSHCCENVECQYGSDFV